MKVNNILKSRFSHSTWIIIFLIILVLALMSYLYSDCHADYATLLSFFESFATLLSIVLSLIAIFYSFYTALEASRQWSDVSKAVNNIKITNKNIYTNYKLMMQSVEAISVKVAEIGAYSKYSNEQKAPSSQEFSNIPNTE